MFSKKVMIFGTFDILHPGHLDFFKQAKKKGDFLIAVVARDINVEKIKGSKPKNSEKKRLGQVSEAGLVDQAVLGDKKDRYKIIKRFKPDVICLGYDQKVNLKKLKPKLREFNLKTKTCRLKAFKPSFYKSSKIQLR